MSAPDTAAAEARLLALQQQIGSLGPSPTAAQALQKVPGEPKRQISV